MLPEWLKKLLKSRKFWLALVAAIVAVVLFVQGGISAEQLVDAIVALVLVLMAAIAGEDMAARLGK